MHRRPRYQIFDYSFISPRPAVIAGVLQLEVFRLHKGKRFSIRFLLLLTLAVAVYLAIPRLTNGLTVTVVPAIWLTFAYNALLFVVLAVFTWLVMGHGWRVICAFAAIFLLNFGPETISALEFTFLGGSGPVGAILERVGLDYNTPFYLTLGLQIAE
jgi:uncharacterized membrane protein YqjE